MVEVVDDNGCTQRVTRPARPADAEAGGADDGRPLLRRTRRGALNAVYEELGSQIGVKKEREITAVFAAGGAFLLLAAGAVSAFLFGRLP